MKINFLLNIKVVCTNKIKKEIRETAAQFALALTRILSINIIINTGREKMRRNLDHR